MTKKKEENEEFELAEDVSVDEEVVASKGDVVETPFVKYRYFCDACTNTAFFSDEATEGLKGVCQVCGKPYVTRKENYILL
jgi:hypothetical protein